METDEQRFIREHAIEERSVATVEVVDGDRPQIIVRHGSYTAVLSIMGMGDHLCIDVHPFVDGAKATAGAFGMSKGNAFKLQGSDTKSHGWDSARIIAVLIGKQS